MSVVDSIGILWFVAATPRHMRGSRDLHLAMRDGPRLAADC